MPSRRTLISAVLLSCCALLVPAVAARAESPEAAVGRWKTVDDNTGETKGIVRTYVQNGKLVGVVEKILSKGHENDRCTKCTGKNKDRPIAGLVILWDLKRDDDGWSGGSIFDPENGSTYRCNITPESGGRLKVRGFIGISLLGRTQYWYRIKDGS